MHIVLKEYKLLKLKSTIKNCQLLYVYQTQSFNQIEWRKVEQYLYNKNCKYLKVSNSQAKFILKSSIFSSQLKIFNNNIVLINQLNGFKNVNTFLDLDNLICTLLIFNKKVYDSCQLQYFNSLDFKLNLKNFIRFLKLILKSPTFNAIRINS